ncbi:MAG: zinc carboxypeptidase [Candidatus Riflebacteria bacterium]|nr:zinc carboxypeptidase [Candidatus Riflebacteria bacterium]
MKRMALAVCLFSLVAGLAWASSTKALVRLSNLSDKEMKLFLGSDFDLVRTGPDFIELVMSREELAVMKKAGKKIREIVSDLDWYVAHRLAEQTPQASYLTYDTMTARLRELAAAHPDIVRLESVGKSIEGRDLWAAKVSDHPDLDEKEPACLLAGAHHAREWTSVMVPMAVLEALVAGYGSDPRLTRLVDERETWIVPMVNPDGVTWSQTKAKYWRKNRRPVGGSFGIDLNRNYGYHWGPTGSSDQPYSDTYHGTGPFSEPETSAIKALAEREHFQTSIHFHSYSELILFPFAYAYDVPNPDEPLYRSVGAEMAAFNTYTVQNCTELYPAAGISDDWLYGEGKTIAFTFEMGREFIPPPTEIAKQCALNVPAVLHLLDRAGAIAVNSPSGSEEIVGALDLPDALAALTMGQALLPRHAGDTRERVAGRLQAAARRAADLVAARLAEGDPGPWRQAQKDPACRPVLPLARTRALFEHCHGHPLSDVLLAEIQKAR